MYQIYTIKKDTNKINKNTFNKTLTRQAYIHKKIKSKTHLRNTFYKIKIFFIVTTTVICEKMLAVFQKWDFVIELKKK